MATSPMRLDRNVTFRVFTSTLLLVEWLTTFPTHPRGDYDVCSATTRKWSGEVKWCSLNEGGFKKKKLFEKELSPHLPSDELPHW